MSIQVTCHRPPRRTIQYAATARHNLKQHGVLDTPPSRGMTMFRRGTTISRDARSSLQRRTAQKFIRLHRTLAGTLQFANPDGALLPAHPEMILEHVPR